MKRNFDEEMRKALQEDPVIVPDHVHQQVEDLLASLPEKTSRKTVQFPKSWQKLTSVAACFVFVMLVVLPNTSVTYAKAVQDIPVIGKLVEVFTVRDYEYFDENHELEADIPSVSDPENKESGDLINKNVKELTDAVIADFYEEMESEGYSGLHITHETLRNTPEWFTLRLTISESAASSSSTIRIYHIDRTSGKYVTFGDIFDSDDRWVLEEMILADMRAQMKADANVSYWEEGTDAEFGFAALTADQNFYFNESGYLVIVYDEFEVAPGYMGAPEFVIGAENLGALAEPEYANLFDYE